MIMQGKRGESGAPVDPEGQHGGAARINELKKQAREKFAELDVERQGSVEGDNVVALAEWVWGSLHEKEPSSSKAQHPSPMGASLGLTIAENPH